MDGQEVERQVDIFNQVTHPSIHPLLGPPLGILVYPLAIRPMVKTVSPASSVDLVTQSRTLNVGIKAKNSKSDTY